MMMTRENQALTSELMVVEEDNAREIGSWMMSLIMVMVMMMIVTVVIMSR